MAPSDPKVAAGRRDAVRTGDAPATPTVGASAHSHAMDDNVTLGERFNRMSDQITTALGSFPALAGSVLIVILWALTGPLFNFSDTWQLFINTTTTVVTFWMVFVIQNSANRNAKATALKLDELIRALDKARNEFITLDQASETVLVAREREMVELADDDESAKPGKGSAAQQNKGTSQRARRSRQTRAPARQP